MESPILLIDDKVQRCTRCKKIQLEDCSFVYPDMLQDEKNKELWSEKWHEHKTMSVCCLSCDAIAEKETVKFENLQDILLKLDVENGNVTVCKMECGSYRLIDGSYVQKDKLSKADIKMIDEKENLKQTVLGICKVCKNLTEQKTDRV